MRIWLTLCVLLVAASASAQPRPGAFTTLTTTSQAPTSICVGCPLGSSTPAAGSGITTASIVLPSGAPAITANKLYSVAGSLFFNGIGLASGSSVSGTTGTHSKFTSPTSLSDSLVSESGSLVTVAGSTTVSGILTVTGFGAHAISAGGAGLQDLLIRNTTAGVGNATRLLIGNDANAGLTVLQSQSSTFTPSGPFLANGSTLAAIGVGGLSILTSVSAPIRFYTGSAEAMRLHASGGVSIGNTIDPATSNLSVSGNLLVGSTGNVTDSSGAPTVGGGWGGAGRAIAGRNYAFIVTIGAGVAGTGFATFSPAYATAPVCTVSAQTVGAAYVLNVATSTTAVEIDGNYIAGDKLYVLCRGF